MVCIKCGEPVSDNAKFCEHCGTQLLGIDDAPPSSGPVPVPTISGTTKKKKSSGSTGICFGILIVSIILFFFSCAGNSLSDYEPGKSEYITMAKSFVKEVLKAPTTAEFCSFSEFAVATSEEGVIRVKGYVDAQNSFGAMIRTNFTVQMIVDDSDRYTCIYMKFGDEEAGTYITGTFKPVN